MDDPINDSENQSESYYKDNSNSDNELNEKIEYNNKIGLLHL